MRGRSIRGSYAAGSVAVNRRLDTLRVLRRAVDTLREAYFGLKRDAAPGVDGETWRAYDPVPVSRPTFESFPDPSFRGGRMAGGPPPTYLEGKERAMACVFEPMRRLVRSILRAFAGGGLF